MTHGFIKHFYFIFSISKNDKCLNLAVILIGINIKSRYSNTIFIRCVRLDFRRNYIKFLNFLPKKAGVQLSAGEKISADSLILVQ